MRPSLRLMVLLCVPLGACGDGLGPRNAPAGQDRVLFVGTGAGNVDGAGRPLDDLYRMNEDGTGLKRLTTESDRYRSLGLSPDGGTVVFHCELSACYDIWVMSADDGALTQLTGVQGYERCNSHPYWSPDGTRIAFLTSRDVQDGLGWEVYVMNADGSDPVDVTANPTTEPETSRDYPRGWSPDGRVVIESSRDGTYRTYLANADGSGVEPLLGDGLYLEPHWSPDGSRLVATAHDFSEVVLMNADGSGVVSLTDEPGMDWLPWYPRDPWSSDGRRVVVGSRRTGDDEIMVADVDGGTLTNVTTNPAGDVFLGWTPDGRILFRSDRGGDDDLYVMNADGTEVVNLTNAPGSEEGPEALWLPRR